METKVSVSTRAKRKIKIRIAAQNPAHHCQRKLRPLTPVPLPRHSHPSPCRLGQFRHASKGPGDSNDDRHLNDMSPKASKCTIKPSRGRLISCTKSPSKTHSPQG